MIINIFLILSNIIFVRKKANKNMGKKIFIIYAFPEKSDYAEALIENYAKGIAANNGLVKKLDLSQFKFDPILWDGYSSTQKMEAELAEAQNLIMWTDHLVFAYPLWWGGMPALLKGFIERVFLPGFAFKFQSGGKIEKLLSNKTARIFVTMHTSPEEYIDKMCGVGEKMLVDGVLEFCGIKTIETKYLGPINKSTHIQRKKWIEEAFENGKQDCTLEFMKTNPKK